MPKKRVKSMHREGNVMKEGKVNTCLCFKEKTWSVAVSRGSVGDQGGQVTFDTKQELYAKLSLQEKHKVVQELKGRLQLQQNVFTKASSKSDAAVKAGFIVAQEIV